MVLLYLSNRSTLRRWTWREVHGTPGGFIGSPPGKSTARHRRICGSCVGRIPTSCVCSRAPASARSAALSSRLLQTASCLLAVFSLPQFLCFVTPSSVRSKDRTSSPVKGEENIEGDDCLQ